MINIKYIFFLIKHDINLILNIFKYIYYILYINIYFEFLNFILKIIFI